MIVHTLFYRRIYIFTKLASGSQGYHTTYQLRHRSDDEKTRFEHDNGQVEFIWVCVHENVVVAAFQEALNH